MLYKRVGSRIAKVKEELDMQQITKDVLKTEVERVAIYSKLCNLLLLQYN